MGNAQSQAQALNESKAPENNSEETNNLSSPALAAPGSPTEDKYDNLNITPIVEEGEGSEDVSGKKKGLHEKISGSLNEPASIFLTDLVCVSIDILAL